MASSRSRVPWFSLLLLILVGTVAYYLPDTFEGTGDPDAPWVGEATRVTSCPENLGKLGELFHEWRAEHPGDEPRSGPGFLIALRREHRIAPGDEELLVCPSDGFALHPTSRHLSMRYDMVNADDPESFAGMVSYAFRDFAHHPIATDEDPNPILAACRCGKDGKSPHHRGGLYVLHVSGRVRFVPWETLGVDPLEGVVLVGPGSGNEQLAKLILPR